MEMTLRIYDTSWIKRILCILLCIAIMAFTFYIDYMQVHAFFPLVLVAIPLGVKIVAGLLIAAGVTFATVYAAQKCAEAYYASTGHTIREDVNSTINGAVNGVANISTQLWNDACTWVNGKFNAGEQTYNSNYAEVQLDSSSETKYPVSIYADNMTADIYPLEEGTQVIYNGDIYTFAKVTTGTAPYLTTKIYIYKNGAELSRTISAIHDTLPWSMYLNVRKDAGNRLQFMVRCYNYDGTPTYIYMDWLNGSEAIGTAAKNSVQPVAITGQSVIDTPGYDIAKQDGTRKIAVPTTEEELVGKVAADITNIAVAPWSNSWTGTFRDCAPTGEYAFTGTGTATIGYGATGIWEGRWTTDISTGARIWTGTYTDAQGNTWTGTIAGQVADNRTWWQDIIGGINTGLDSLGQLLVGTLAQIKAAIESVGANIQARIQETTAAIEAEKENAKEADMTNQMRSYKIPDLFILILKVILACIRLILRALVFIATLPAIPANAGDINGNFLSGVNFLKNQTIPFFGVSLWSMVTGVIAIFFGLAVVKRVRRIYSV